MQILGEWHVFDDGACRPIVWAQVSGSGPPPVMVPFLVDTGADHTVLSAAWLDALGGMTTDPSPHLSLTGVGGKVAYRLLRTALLFPRVGGQPASVRGDYAILTDLSSGDMSVIGRDVLDNFATIVDRPGARVVLLTGRHRYRVEAT